MMYYTPLIENKKKGFTPLLINAGSDSTSLDLSLTSQLKPNYNNDKPVTGFTLIEILVVIGIIGLLAVGVFVALSKTTVKAKDTKRKAEIHQMGRFLQFGCRMPSDGSFDIDLLAYANQLVIQYPQYQQYLSNIPRDPTLGNETQSGYRYTISSNGQKCALYANLENEEEPVTLSTISLPTPGGGTGVLQSSAPGPNGTTKYYQFSN